jgi:hypothetical protein
MNGAKGTTLRSVFEAANRLKAHTCAMMNSDLRSVTADWVKYLLVLMSPLYFARVASFIPFFNYPLSLKYVTKTSMY